MSVTNYVFIFTGGLVALIGGLSLIFPGLTKIISLPGNKTIQSLIALIIGLIFLIIGLLVELPINS